MKLLAMASAALVALTCGCSTFDYEYRREARKSMPTDAITGPWEGKWISETTGHKGGLRALISRESDGRYRTRFHASYKTILRFGYTVMLEAQQATNGVNFHGTANLGKLAGGVYTYEGYASPTNFFSTYSASSDRGTFQMTRPEQ